MLFSDPGMSLVKVDDKNRTERIAEKAEICQYEDRLTCAGRVFPLAEIGDMAMTQSNRLMFSAGDGYYQIKSRGNVNLRKYLEIWNDHHSNRRQ